MSAIDNLRIGIKLPFAMVLIAVIMLLLTEIIALRNLREAVLDAGHDRLVAVATSRASALASEMNAIRADLNARATSPATVAALRAFSHAWTRIGDNTPEVLREVYGRYPEGGEGTLALLQGAQASYGIAHERYHKDFQRQFAAHGFGDILLIDPKGNIVYSVAKAADFAGNLMTSDLRSSSLSRVGRGALRGDGFSLIRMDAPAPYAPAGGVSSIFIGAPVFDSSGTLEGAVVYRIPTSKLTDFVRDAPGVGPGGRVVVIGPDGDLLPFGSAPVDASRTVTGVSVVMGNGEDGESQLAASATIELSGENYTVAANQPLSKILKPMVDLRENMIEQGVVALVAVAAIGFAIARSLSAPLTGVGRAIESVARGEYGTAIPGFRRRDEIGGIARALDRFRASLVEAEGVARESAFKGAAFEGTSAALILVDSSLTILYANRAFETLIAEHSGSLGRILPDLAAGSLVGRNLILLFHGAPGAVARLEGGNLESISQEVSFGQTVLTLEIGKVRPEGAELLGYVVEVQDVTELRLRGSVLSAVELTRVVGEFATDGRLIHANAKFREFAGLPGGMTGLKFVDLVEWSGADPWQQIAEGRAATGHLRRAGAEHSEPSLHATLSPVLDASGILRGAVLLADEAGGAGRSGADAPGTARKRVRAVPASGSYGPAA